MRETRQSGSEGGGTWSQATSSLPLSWRCNGPMRAAAVPPVPRADSRELSGLQPLQLRVLSPKSEVPGPTSQAQSPKS